MNYLIQYTPLGRADLEDITRYFLDQRMPEVAIALLDAIESHIAHLAQFPYAHALWPAPLKLPSETRYLPVKSYIVFYTVIEPAHIVEIRRVLHERLDLPLRLL